MKHFLLSMLVSVPAIAMIAQPTIKNASLENWTTKSDGKLYPDDWYCDTFYIQNDYVKRVSGGSQGSYALQVGCFTVSGQVYGAELGIADTLLSLPGSLQFDYKTVNVTGINGLSVKVYLYDKDGGYIKDYSWYSDGNNGGFQTGTLALPYGNNPAPAKVAIRVSYFTFNGQANEYGIIDNFRFQKKTNSDIQTVNPSTTFRVYPNPATNMLFIESNSPDLDRVQLLSADGKSIELALSNSSLDVSGMSTGIYTMLLYNASGAMLGRRIVNIAH